MIITSNWKKIQENLKVVRINNKKMSDQYFTKAPVAQSLERVCSRFTHSRRVKVARVLGRNFLGKSFIKNYLNRTRPRVQRPFDFSFSPGKTPGKALRIPETQNREFKTEQFSPGAIFLFLFRVLCIRFWGLMSYLTVLS